MPCEESEDVIPGSDSSLIALLLTFATPFSFIQRCWRTSKSSSNPSCVIVESNECRTFSRSRMSCVNGNPPCDSLRALPGQLSPACNRLYNSLKPETSCDCCCSSISTYPFGYTLSCAFFLSPNTQIALSALHLLHGLEPSHLLFFNRHRSHALQTRFRVLSSEDEVDDALCGIDMWM